MEYLKLKYLSNMIIDNIFQIHMVHIVYLIRLKMVYTS